MAELPRVPISGSVSTPIKYSVGERDIAGPYTAISQATDKLSGALSDVAVPLAEQAAADTVRRDDNGNLIVDKLPFMVGDAAKAARLTVAAKLQPQIETDLLRHKVDNPNNPEGFMASVNAYKPALMKGLDGSLAVGVGKMIDNTSQQYLRSLIVEKDAHDTQEFKDSMEAQLTRNTDQRQVLARQEGGTGTKEYADLVKDSDTIINKLRDHAKIKLSPEKAKLLKDQAIGEDMGQSIVGQTIRTFQTKKNKVEAQRFLMDWAWGEPSKKLPLSPRQRDHIVSEGLKSLETMSAEDTKAITASKANITAFTAHTSKNPDAFREAPFNDLLQAARAVGDKDGERMLFAFHDMLPTFQILGGQSSADRDRQINAIGHLVGGAKPGPLPDEAFTNALGPGVPVDFRDAAAVHVWNQANEIGKARAAADAQSTYDELKKSVDERRPITAGQVRQFFDLAHLGHKEDLAQKLIPSLSVLVDRGQISRAESNAVVSELRQAVANNPDPMAQKTYEAAAKMAEEDTAEMNKNPLDYTINRLGGAPRGVLDTSKPDAFTGEVASRAPTMAKFHAVEKEHGGASWVNESEGDLLYGQITQSAKPEDAASAMRTLASIPDTDGDGLATLTQKKIMGAIIDAGHSMDPVRMEAAMKVQEALREAHPHEYTATYGPEAEKHLMTYQALRGAFTPAEIAERMNRPVAGRDRAARAEIEKNVKDKDLKDLTAEDVAWQLGDFRGIGRLTGATPYYKDAIPADGTSRTAFLNEFKDGVAMLVGSGVEDVGKAQTVMAQKMAKEWTVSRVNGNRFMKYAPEQIYNNPPLPDDPDGRWIRQQLDERISAIRGPQVTAGAEGRPGEGPGVNWRFDSLVPDAQTKYEFEHGMPPTYHIWITDENGQHTLLTDAQGNTRHGFDAFGIPKGSMTNYHPDSPAGRAFEAKRIALQKAQRIRELQTQARDWNPDVGPTVDFGPTLKGIGSALGRVGKFMSDVGRPVPTYNHDLHVGARDGGE